jgi:hypothetical protein
VGCGWRVESFKLQASSFREIPNSKSQNSTRRVWIRIAIARRRTRLRLGGYGAAGEGEAEADEEREEGGN